MSDAIDICWMSRPMICINPNVIASVIGIDNAISRAERHSQNPTKETRTTSSDRFPQAAIEQVQLLAHLTLLIGRRADDEIGRK